MNRNLIIIAKIVSQDDREFYYLILREDYKLKDKALLIPFASVRHFDQFIHNARPDFEFSLLIHMGNKAPEPETDGEMLTDQLKELPYFEKLKFDYTSRQGDGSFGGRVVHHTQKLHKQDFDLSILPLNKISDLLVAGTHHKKFVGKAEEHPVIPLRLEFAILTALDKDENDVFRDHLTHQKSIDTHTVEGILDGEAGYRKPILVSTQRQIGMVDAAFSSAEIINVHNPEFLIMSGVCGGRSSQVKLFDVIIPEKVYDFTFGSLESGKYVPRDIDAKLNQKLIQFLRRQENVRKMKEAMRSYHSSTRTLSMWDNYVNNAEIHFYVMACGPWVVKTEGYLEKLSKEKNDMICALDMESYSIGRAYEIHDNKVITLVIKSVMDMTNEHKSDLVQGLPVKKIAGYISYLCTRAVMDLIQDFKHTNR